MIQLAWSDYKAVGEPPNDSRHVHFPGGFQLYVVRHDRHFRLTKTWRVMWYDAPPMRGLTDRRFRTRRDAQRAAERVFVPLCTIAPQLVGVKVTKTVGVEGALRPPKRRKR